MEADPERASPCLYVLAGWLLASAQLGSAARSIDAREAALRMPAAALRPPETDPDRMSPRELRGLPAIGPTRALAIARARWERALTGGPESWEDIQGIGPETVRAIQSARAPRAAGTREGRDP